MQIPYLTVSQLEDLLRKLPSADCQHDEMLIFVRPAVDPNVFTREQHERIAAERPDAFRMDRVRLRRMRLIDGTTQWCLRVELE
jgi:hypothetical protein